jgi:hypothetical protein
MYYFVLALFCWASVIYRAIYLHPSRAGAEIDSENEPRALSLATMLINTSWDGICTIRRAGWYGRCFKSIVRLCCQPSLTGWQTSGEVALMTPCGTASIWAVGRYHYHHHAELSGRVRLVGDVSTWASLCGLRASLRRGISG